MAILSAFTKNTAKNMQLDAGLLVRGLTDILNFNGIIADDKKLGATSGGASFSATPEMRNIFEGIDGAKGNYKDGNVIDNWEITLTATVKEMTAKNLQLAMATADIKSDDDKFDVLTPRMEVKSTDYIDNICWLGTMNGSSEPMIIELKNVMNTNGISFTAEDKGSGSVELELKAHFDLSKPNEVPFNIYFPKQGRTVSMAEFVEEY
ncbi:MAG: hypothetical protein SPJ53_04755 [Lactobacillus amylovorus]|nr:hypothetical protein [Lactobacillus amylovorus]